MKKHLFLLLFCGLLLTVSAQKEELGKALFFISSDADLLAFTSFNGYTYSGYYTVANNVLTVEFIVAYDEEGVSVECNEKQSFAFINEEIYVPLVASESYVVYGVYSRA